LLLWTRSGNEFSQPVDTDYVSLERATRLITIAWVIAWGMGIVLSVSLGLQLVLTAGAIVSFALMYLTRFRSGSTTK
jgi:hypothetical protein